MEGEKASHFLVNFGFRFTDVYFTITNFIAYTYSFEYIKCNFSKVFNCIQSTNRVKMINIYRVTLKDSKKKPLFY